ncbi:hypothetical protein M409DRAFT_63862 [Zasmidium cellare ATCC 36951]|uniref:GPR1/FUN34/YaaH-class plasma membrane protein n=1 Tax=Zasmidium cellare ATCC 36951 TaxID=1080233 RepID=A0A6A6CUG5_ZASCE|nr:uncharacterized protein M409DRAFT_63862 [Zasmidium cellare ATCC 36951]KAF2170804.1 hypothetical protein M409DRAFT_63862 [Zasmidium cellare ATCC 36951]
METLAIPRQTFEKIYLNPPIDVKGDLRNIYANPTPLGLVGFLVATMPVSFQLMRLGRAGGDGAATVGLSFYFGGMLQLLACVMEWVLGNTFSFLVFGSFGAAWFALSSLNLEPFASGSHSVYANEAEFDASFAYGLITFGLLTLTFGFCALRTNIIFVFCFLSVSIALFIFAGSFFAMAHGHSEAAAKMQFFVGGTFFSCCVMAWYLLIANLLEVLEFGVSLPVGDLSRRLKGIGRKPEYRDRSKSV